MNAKVQDVIISKKEGQKPLKTPFNMSRKHEQKMKALIPELQIGGPRVVDGNHRQKGFRGAGTNGHGQGLDVLVGVGVL